ncbi:MAG TPA: hypothetical protein VLL54_05160 [Pyrinomonadaceae bacterium]|nr:hypothetical protein [Pyrinomonadaceae bacterium]
MIPKVQRSFIAFTLLFALLCQAPSASACGPFTLGAVFSFSVHPEYPLEKFAGGEIGIVQPSYARSYLYVAYRYLNDSKLSETEQQAAVELWRDRLDLRWDFQEESAVKEWLAARGKVSGVGEAPKFEVYRNREKPNEYDSYLNCQKDAFETATATLEARIGKLGADSAPVKDWVAAQDLVFQNCSDGQHVPSELPASADSAIRADRQYQIAAANFYSGNFPAAKTLFESISHDTSSPWRLRAPYLKARTSLRAASLGPDEKKQEHLSEAEQELNDVLQNAELKSSHAAARRLLAIVRLRLHPGERMHELAKTLTNDSEPADLKQNLWDYTILLDQFLETDAHHQQTAKTADLHADDLTDWIATFQDNHAESLAHAISKWEATAATSWLIAALSKVDPRHAEASRLQQAAAKISPSSAAFPLAAFHSIRLDVAAGRAANARAKLDELLQRQHSRFNTSSLNLLQHERMLVATSVDDLLTHAQQMPAGFSWDEDGREIPADADEISSELKSIQGQSFFDPEASETLNHQLSVALLAEAANSKRLPEHLRRDVAQAAWLRAALLGNHATATALVPTLKTLVPALVPFLNEYTAAPDPAAKKFAAINAWLNFPGMQPVVTAGMGRGARPLDDQDSYRDNWWCAGTKSDSSDTPDTGAPATVKSNAAPAFLSATQLTIAAKEYATLSSIDAVPNYLCQQVIAWATAQPSDPRIPEALHHAVKSTRYGCTNKQTGRWSKAAYDFLHKHYPGNTWTKQTPYWFKD